MLVSRYHAWLRYLLILLALVLAGCGGKPTARNAVLRLTQEGLGVVAVNDVERAIPWSGKFEVDSEITLRARPDAGYEFVGWTGDITSADNPLYFQLRKETTVNATFARAPAISVTPTSRDFGPVQVDEWHELNFTVENPGGGLLVGTASSAAPFSVVAGANYSIGPDATHLVTVRFNPTDVGSATGTVTFTGAGGSTVTVTGIGVQQPPTRVSLEVTVAGSGNVVSDPPGITCPGSCSATYVKGSDVVLTAAPDTPGQNAHWTGCDSPPDDGAATSCVIVMHTDREVSATFPTAPEVGIRISPTTTTLFTGGSRSFTATIAGTTDTRVTWTTTGGRFTGTGTTVTYTAPDTAGSYTVTATSVADATKSASANVIVDARRVVQLAGGEAHSLALKNDGTVWAWGDNSSGQLGDGTTITRYSPIQVPSLTNITRIAAGGKHSLAMRADGVLFAWGSNQYGQLGIDSSDLNSLVPVSAVIPGPVTEIAAGTEHSVALTDDGTVWTWGRNSVAQLGDGSLIDRRRPVALSGLEPVVAVAAGEEHSLAVDQQGTVYGWGNNAYGQSGAREDASDCPVFQIQCIWTPHPVRGAWGARSLSAGYKFNLATYATGSTRSWGQNLYGQLGVASGDACTPAPGALLTHPCSFTPLTVEDLPPVRLIRAGARHALAVTTEGDLYSWGLNTSGQLGVESTDACLLNPGGETAVCSKLPLQVNALSSVLTVGAGSAHSLAVLTDGTVWAWGDNERGQLGIGSVVSYDRPVLVGTP